MKKIFTIVLLIVIVLLISALIISIKESKKLKGLKIKQISETESKATLGQNTYTALFVPKAQIAPYFGLAKNEFDAKMALIQKDLPENVKSFVVKHEIYHLQDNQHSNFLSREITANLAAAYYEPFGFFMAIWLTIKDTERIKYYFSKL